MRGVFSVFPVLVPKLTWDLYCFVFSDLTVARAYIHLITHTHTLTHRQTDTHSLFISLSVCLSLTHTLLMPSFHNRAISQIVTLEIYFPQILFSLQMFVLVCTQNTITITKKYHSDHRPQITLAMGEQHSSNCLATPEQPPRKP